MDDYDAALVIIGA